MQNAQKSKKNFFKNSRIIVSDFKACYKAVLVKIVWYSLKDRHMYQWNTTGVQKLALTIAINWFPKRYHVCLKGKRSFFFFLRNGAKKNWIYTWIKLSLDPYFILYAKIKIDQRPKHELTYKTFGIKHRRKLL